MRKVYNPDGTVLKSGIMWINPMSYPYNDLHITVLMAFVLREKFLVQVFVNRRVTVHSKHNGIDLSIPVTRSRSRSYIYDSCIDAMVQYAEWEELVKKRHGV